MIYILCFVFSALFIWIGTKKCTVMCMNTDEWKYIRLKKFPVSIGILILAILAALRDTSIGSDVEYYVVPYFKQAVNSSEFFRYMADIGGNKTDIGYNLLNFIISRFTDNIGWLFFFVELIILCFVFAGCWQFRFMAAPWLSMLCYYLVFYNMTLSTLRQCCACAISFYAIAYAIRYNFQKDAVVRAGIYIVLAMTFHKTALFSAVIFVIFGLIHMDKINPVSFGMLVVLCCAAFRIFSNQFIFIITRIARLISTKYTIGFLSDSGGASGYTSIIMVSAFTLVIQCLLLRGNRKGCWKNISKALLTINIIYISGMLFLAAFSFVPRMLYYVQMFWNISLAQCTKVVKNSLKNKALIIFFVLLFLTAYWIFFYAYGRVHGTYPYVLRLGN